MARAMFNVKYMYITYVGNIESLADGQASIEFAPFGVFFELDDAIDAIPAPYAGAVVDEYRIVYDATAAESGFFEPKLAYPEPSMGQPLVRIIFLDGNRIPFEQRASFVQRVWDDIDV